MFKQDDKMQNLHEEVKEMLSDEVQAPMRKSKQGDFSESMRKPK
jgi:23S rRNA maturation mini-RNase III